jgi:hypothetical protein
LCCSVPLTTSGPLPVREDTLVLDCLLPVWRRRASFPRRVATHLPPNEDSGRVEPTACACVSIRALSRRQARPASQEKRRAGSGVPRAAGPAWAYAHTHTTFAEPLMAEVDTSRASNYFFFQSHAHIRAFIHLVRLNKHSKYEAHM